MVTRIVFSLCLWVVLARWGYSEVKLLCPPLVPYIDQTLEYVQIPTHDKWPKEQMLKLLGTVINQIKSAEFI